MNSIKRKHNLMNLEQTQLFKSIKQLLDQMIQQEGSFQEVIQEEAKESSRITESVRPGSAESLKGFGTQNIGCIGKSQGSEIDQLVPSDDENETERYY